MAVNDISYKALNNQKRATNASVASLDFTLEGGVLVVSGDSYITGFLPRGALITGVTVVPVVGFNAGTTATMSVGNAGSATAYLTGVDIKATTVVKSALPLPIYLPTGDSIYLTPTFTGTVPTVGSVRVIFDYVEVNTLAGSYNN